VKTASEMTYTVSGGALNSTQTKPNPTLEHGPAIANQLLSWTRGPIAKICHYTQGEMTSQNLRPRYYRHFVGITRYSLWSYGAKTYRAVYITFDPLVYGNVCMITNLPTKRISALSR